MGKKRNREFISYLNNGGAVILKSHNSLDLKDEIQKLINQNSQVTVVACGGDGTVNLALNSILDLPVKFAVVPMGTGNDFSRHIGIRTLTQAFKVLEENYVQKIDIGQIEFEDGQVKVFGAVASCGFDADVNERANQISGPNGTAKYLWSVITQLHNLKPLNLKIEYQSQFFSGLFTLVAIGNTSTYGGGMRITPAADFSDGKFNVTFVKQVKRRTLLKVLPTVFWGKHVFHPKVSIDQMPNIRISGHNFSIYADGERMGVGPAEFKVLPSFISLLVPKTI